MMTLKSTAFTVAAVAALALGTDAFIPPCITPSSSTTAPLCMGKSSVVPGPSKSGSSGPAASEYRMKKMSDRMKKKKKKKNKKGKKGGFDDEEDVLTPTGEKKMMDQPLAVEPDGGEHVPPLPGGPGAEKAGYTIRLKDLGPVSDDDEAYHLQTEEHLGRTVHNFWMTAVADGNEIEKIRLEVLKQCAKNFNFPGFRKGQVPPYQQPKMTNFALQEVLVSSCQEAISRFGVNEINEGQLGAVTFNEDVEELSKKYNIQSFPSVPFTANFRATFDPEAVREGDAASDGDDEADKDVAQNEE